MEDKSRINRTTVSDFGNIRDSEDDDDNEFFANNENPEDEECETTIEPTGLFIIEIGILRD